MLGKLFSFRQQTVDRKTIEHFTRVCHDMGLDLDYARNADRIKELIEQPGDGPEGIEELARLLDRDDPNKSRF
ncbi:MAG: hypothetical protein KDE14_01490 [Rhodobacteraceae bacterium]|nr:hypothetical protein [Paracoccaceae bacterium]